MIKKIIILILVFLFVLEATWAKVNTDADILVSAGSGYSSTKLRDNKDYTDHLAFVGLTHFLYTLSGKQGSVKGKVRMSVQGNSADGLLFELSRAYVRKRVKFSPSYAMQVELGKNTVAWGEGDYYNAGDVIFGADPKTSNLGSNTEFRDFSFLQSRALFPISTASYVEVLLGIPDQKYIITSSQNAQVGGIVAPTSNIKEAGAGTRLHVEANPFQIETGAYSRFLDEKISPYASLALPLQVRIYVASGMDIAYGEGADAFSEQVEEHLGVSTGALYITQIDESNTISVQGEVLMKNNLRHIQLNGSWFFTRVFGFIMRGTTTLENHEYAFIFGPQWKPEDGLTIGIHTNMVLDFNDDTDTNAVYMGGIFMMQYKF